MNKQQCFRARTSLVPSSKSEPHELRTGPETLFRQIGFGSASHGRQDVLSTCHPADKHARPTRVL